MSLIRRLAPSLAARFRQNERFLNFSSSSSVLHHATSSSYVEPVHITENCVRRMKELEASESTTSRKMLRLSVETGGCSGFQYAFDLDDDSVNSDDRVFEKEGIKLVVDSVSYDFVKGATVDYVEELIRSAFVVTENPSAVGGCSCKSSFMVKQ
uniref:Core domain-containing protein n=1 Tax=Lotus japonicus TaxID=34305 RepID=I3SWV2_LOTJA|nr:unknown [Lotus japonicus]